MSTQHSLVVLARGGYAARGVLYLIIGIFALLAAHDSTRPKDSHKSLEALLGQPFGYFLVGLVVAGLLAFAAWRVLQATRDVDHHGTKFKGLVIRAGLFSGGVVNGALAFFALGLLMSGIRSSGGSGANQRLAGASVVLGVLEPVGVPDRARSTWCWSGAYHQGLEGIVREVF